jgi:signal transduction histidine kinase
VLKVFLESPSQLPILPAAVEVAAYRIITEALVNVVKHAKAAECGVRISVLSGCELEIEVCDDGIGLPIFLKPSINGGIGMKSIRERTAELGGQCFFEKSELGGTRVRAVLPFSQGKEKAYESSINR